MRTAAHVRDKRRDNNSFTGRSTETAEPIGSADCQTGTRRAKRITAAELAQLVEIAGPLAVDFGLLKSAMMVLLETLGGRQLGAPQQWRSAATSQLDPRDLAALEPFVTSDPTNFPSCIMPVRRGLSLAALDEQLEAIAATSGDVFVSQIDPDGPWGTAARNPARWLDAYVRAARRACEGMQEPWRSAAGLFDRETERVGVAVARGTVSELASGVVPPTIPRVQTSSLDNGDARHNRLRMVPLLAGPPSTHVGFSGRDLTHIAYPVPGIWRLLHGVAPPPAGLDALLGAQRTLILRSLDRPVTAGKLAAALLAVPSAATHHLAILERAGLIVRERQGRQVLVHRTARGTEILSLYERL